MARPLSQYAALGGLIAICALAGCGGGGGSVGYLSGSVLDARQGDGIAGVAVSIDGTAYVTDSSGQFSAPALSAGAHTVRATATGYTTVGPLTVAVAADATSLAPIYMLPVSSSPPGPPPL